MDQIIEAFGIDLRLIIIQVVNFGLLMFALGYFLYTPVLKVLRDREEKIAKGIADAAAASEKLDAAESEKRSIIATAQTEAVAIEHRAKEHADKKADAILADAQTKAANIASDAATQAEATKAAALKDSEAAVAKMAILAAEKILATRTK